MHDIPVVDVEYDAPQLMTKAKKSHAAKNIDVDGVVHEVEHVVPTLLQNLNMEGFHRPFVPLATSEFRNMRFSYFFNVDGAGQCTNVSQQVPSYRGTTATCAEADILTPAKKSYILDVLLPRAATYLTNALNVVRVSGNLTITGTRCGSTPGVVIPDAHKSPGIPNTDFVMYVAANPQSTPSATVAFASTCFRDQNGRPIAGFINFVPSALSNAADLKSSLTALDVNTAIHEVCHALGFSGPFFTSYGWVNESGARFASGGTMLAYNNNTGKTTSYMTTPRVLREAKKYFSCNSMVGVEIEDQGGSGTQGSHWEKRLLFQEFIAGVLCTSRTYISSLTLAYFEDTGFYTANYAYAEDNEMNWGKGKGCSFVEQKCNSAANQASGEFCFDTSLAPMCTYDLTAGGACQTANSASSLPAAFRYFPSESTRGGSVAVADYCPAVLPYSNRVCIESTNFDTQDIYGNTYHPASRCFMSNLIQSDFDTSATLETRCFPFSCSLVSGAILLNIRGQTVRCPANLQAGYADVTRLRGYKGSIYCPPASALCADPSAPTPAPTPAPPTPVPTPAPPGYTPAPAPVVRTAKIWYNFDMPEACADREPCAANLTELFPSCRLLAKRLVDCFGTNCDTNIQSWLSQKGFTSQCGDMDTMASKCQESYQGAGELCTLATGSAARVLSVAASVLFTVFLTIMMY